MPRLDQPALAEPGFCDWLAPIELVRYACLARRKQGSGASDQGCTGWFDVPHPTLKRLALFRPGRGTPGIAGLISFALRANEPARRTGRRWAPIRSPPLRDFCVQGRYLTSWVVPRDVAQSRHRCWGRSRCRRRVAASQATSSLHPQALRCRAPRASVGGWRAHPSSRRRSQRHTTATRAPSGCAGARSSRPRCWRRMAGRERPVVRTIRPLDARCAVKHFSAADRDRPGRGELAQAFGVVVP
jgi:hypothetical protein